MAEELITLAHGSGGRPMQQLIQEVFLKFFDHPALTALTDAACLSWPSSYQLCFTTDAYVVQPLFFPGGNIGKLAFCGTINDLAVSGAQPLYLSCAFIIEEGFSVALLEKILASMKQMVCQTGVAVVTGDTKVVERGKLDGLCIATSGVGIRPASLKLCRESLRPGDKVIVSGPLGDHEIAILSARGKFQLETRLASDCAPLHSLTERMLKVEPNLRFMRDPTRGGLAAVLNEIVSGLKVGILIEEKLLPVRKEVAACCEILGLDPLLLASEGRLVAVVPEKTTGQVLTVMKRHPLGRQARVVGQVISDQPGRVLMKTLGGSTRLVEMPAGVQQPRIC